MTRKGQGASGRKRKGYKKDSGRRRQANREEQLLKNEMKKSEEDRHSETIIVRSNPTPKGSRTRDEKKRYRKTGAEAAYGDTVKAFPKGNGKTPFWVMGARKRRKRPQRRSKMIEGERSNDVSRLQKEQQEKAISGIKRDRVKRYKTANHRGVGAQG